MRPEDRQGQTSVSEWTTARPPGQQEGTPEAAWARPALLTGHHLTRGDGGGNCWAFLSSCTRCRGRGGAASTGHGREWRRFCLGSRNRFLIFGSEPWRVKLTGLWSRGNCQAEEPPASHRQGLTGEPSGQRLAFPGNARRGKVSPTP